jgi:hypothetical protein
LNETRFVGAVPQCDADFPYGSVEALVQILESPVAPQGHRNDITRHKLGTALHQEDKQVERYFLQPDRSAVAGQLVAFGY